MNAHKLNRGRRRTISGLAGVIAAACVALVLAGCGGGGTELSNGNLSFTNPTLDLNPGTYWITAWVVRPETTGNPPGGEWLWNETTVVTGSQAFVDNPGLQYLGLYGITTTPVPGGVAVGMRVRF